MHSEFLSFVFLLARLRDALADDTANRHRRIHEAQREGQPLPAHFDDEMENEDDGQLGLVKEEDEEEGEMAGNAATGASPGGSASASLSGAGSGSASSSISGPAGAGANCAGVGAGSALTSALTSASTSSSGSISNSETAAAAGAQVESFFMHPATGLGAFGDMPVMAGLGGGAVGSPMGMPPPMIVGQNY